MDINSSASRRSALLLPTTTVPHGSVALIADINAARPKVIGAIDRLDENITPA
jgi:hypothetical protein